MYVHGLRSISIVAQLYRMGLEVSKNPFPLPPALASPMPGHVHAFPGPRHGRSFRIRCRRGQQQQRQQSQPGGEALSGGRQQPPPAGQGGEQRLRSGLLLRRRGGNGGELRHVLAVCDSRGGDPDDVQQERQRREGGRGGGPVLARYARAGEGGGSAVRGETRGRRSERVPRTTNHLEIKSRSAPPYRSPDVTVRTLNGMCTSMQLRCAVLSLRVVVFMLPCCSFFAPTLHTQGS